MFTVMRYVVDVCISVLAYMLFISICFAQVEISKSAHWLDIDRIAWTPPEGVKEVILVYSGAAKLQNVIQLAQPFHQDSFKSTFDLQHYPLLKSNLGSNVVPLNHPVDAMTQWQGSWSAEMAKTLLKGQVWLLGLNEHQHVLALTQLQTFRVLDALYTESNSDADETVLGPIYDDNGNVTVRLWAPTAQQVELHIFDINKQLLRVEKMFEDTHSGIWQYSANDLNGLYYQFNITLYHPEIDRITSYNVTDPYSVSLSVNSTHSQFINLNDPALKPNDWDTYLKPALIKPEDAVIYEGHIRDFSILDLSTPKKYRGKFQAFTVSDSTPVQHLKRLAKAGVTHFHMLPVNDIAMINELPNTTIGLEDTVQQLCDLNPRAELCRKSKKSTLIIDLLSENAQKPDAKAPQSIVQQMRDYDGFNWGYDPFHFNVPEGSYAVDPDGAQRILTFRKMVQSLHYLGLRVVMDVVFNHTHASGMHAKSVLDRVVPGYYHRLDVRNGQVLRDSCCPDTEDQARMMFKLMYDSMKLWSEQYKIDDFRFDLMGLHSKDTMLALYKAMKAVNPETYFYGEAWRMPERFVVQADQNSMLGSGIGMFNDRFRNAIRNGYFFYPNEDLDKVKKQIKIGLAGSIKSFGGFVDDPQEVINYVSKHDDHTLWDQLQRVLPHDFSTTERVRLHNVSLGLTLVAQGVPFLQMGGELMRSKSLDRNSFDSGDWFNRVDFSLSSNNWGIGLPLAFENRQDWPLISRKLNDDTLQVSSEDIKFSLGVFEEFVKIRQSTPLLRLSTAKAIEQKLTFVEPLNSDANHIVILKIIDGTDKHDIDPEISSLLLIVNGQREATRVGTSLTQDYTLHDIQSHSIDQSIREAQYKLNSHDNDSVGSELFIPAQSIAVFVEKQVQ